MSVFDTCIPHRGTVMNVKQRVFTHKKYYRSFIKLRLNHWCHIDYFNDVLTTFLGLERGNCVVVYVGSESFNQKYFNLCSEDERRSNGFGMTLAWVINDKIFIFRWTIPLMSLHSHLATCLQPLSATKTSKIFQLNGALLMYFAI